MKSAAMATTDPMERVDFSGRENKDSAEGREGDRRDLRDDRRRVLSAEEALVADRDREKGEDEREAKVDSEVFPPKARAVGHPFFPRRRRGCRRIQCPGSRVTARPD